MQGDSSSFFMLIVFFAFLWVASFIFKKNKEQESAIKQRQVAPKTSIQRQPPPPSKIVPPSFTPTPKNVPAYFVEKKQEKKILKKGWRSKSALKEAFVFSEILKRWEDDSR